MRAGWMRLGESMRQCCIGGYLGGEMVPIVLGADRVECLRKLRAALKATPFGVDDLAPLCFFVWVYTVGEKGSWHYSDHVKHGPIARAKRGIKR